VSGIYGNNPEDRYFEALLNNHLAEGEEPRHDKHCKCEDCESEKEIENDRL